MHVHASYGVVGCKHWGARAAAIAKLGSTVAGQQLELFDGTVLVQEVQANETACLHSHKVCAEGWVSLVLWARPLEDGLVFAIMSKNRLLRLRGCQALAIAHAEHAHRLGAGHSQRTQTMSHMIRRRVRLM